MSKFKQWFILCFMAALLVPCWYGNVNWYRVQSVMDDPIRDENNLRVQAEQYALESGIEYTNPLIAYVEMPRANRDNLLAVVNFTEKLQSFLNEREIEAKVVSLSTRTNYGPDSVGKFVSLDSVLNSDFDSERWIQQAIQNISIRGSMIGRHDDGDYTIVIVFPSIGTSEIELAKNFLIFANGWWDYESPLRIPEDFGKWREDAIIWVSLNSDPEINLHSSFNNFEIDGFDVHSEITVDPTGWSFNRPIIDITSRAYSIAPIAGMLMGCLFLFWILLGSWRQAVAAVSVISLSFGFGRGFIGVCDTFLFEMSSDTFTIIAFFAIIIPSTSINFHHLKTFNATRKEGFDTEASYWRRWDEAIKSISVIKLIVFVSAIDFLWTMTFKNLHGSRSVMDMGIVAAFGITVSWLLARFFLPVLLGFLGGKTESVKENQSALSLWVNQKTAYVVRVAQRWAAWRHSWKVSLGALLVVVLAAVGLYQYYINTNNNPTEFEKNTMAEAITKKLNLLGRPGASLYSPVVQVDLSDAKSLDQLREYLGTVSGFSRTTYSPFYDFMVVLGDYGYKTGDSIEEVIRNEAKLSLKDAASELSSENIDKEMQLIISDIWKMMWDNDGNLLKFFVSSPYGDKFNNIVVMLTDAGESTPEIRAFRDRFVEAGEGFDLIKIHPASKLSQWPDNDEYVTDGNLKYNFLSQVVVVIFCLIYFLGKDWAGGVKSLTKVACFAGIILALKCGLLVSVPFFWALAVMYLVMMIFRIPLDIASSAISSMAVSIAVDFPLMIIDRFRSLKQEGSFEKVIMSEEMNEVGVSVAFDSIANAFLLSALLAVKITPVVRLGVLEEVVILSCVTGTMFLVFPFLRWIHR